MSLFLFLCVSAGVATAGWVTGRRARERYNEKIVPALPAPQLAPNPFTAFPFGLGDVLLRSKSDEVLIAGGLRLSEGGQPVAAVFIGPASRGVVRIAVVFPSSKAEVLWLRETPAEVGAEAPLSLSLPGGTLDRTRRLPVVVESFGADLPEVDRESIFAEYHGGPEQAAFVLRGKTRLFVAAGESVSQASIDRLPGS